MKIEHETLSANIASPTINSLAEKNTALTENVLSVDSRSQVTRLVREGITAAKAGNLSLARSILLDAVAIDNQHETALMWLASISDKPHELLDYLQQVLIINPANERAQQWATATKSLLVKSLIQQGAASHKEGMPEIAMQYFLQATELDQNSEMAWLWLVSVATEPENKLSYLNRVLSLNPTHEKALVLFHRTKTQIARSLIKKGTAAAVSGDRKMALEILDDVMEYNSNLEEAWLLKAFLSDSKGEKTFCFEKALEINPDSSQAISGLDNLKAETKDEDNHAPVDTAEAASVSETPLEEVASVSEMPLEQVEMAAEEPPLQHLTEISAVEKESVEDFIEDDTVATEFVADHYVNVESVDEESVEEELVQEQVSAFSETVVPSLPTDFTSTISPIVVEDFESEQQSPEQSAVELEIEPEISFDEETYVTVEPEAETIAETIFEVVPETLVECQFCKSETKESLVRCQNCGAFTRLEDFDHLLNNELNQEEVMREFIERWQAESAGRELTADEYFNLGLGYLNLRNVKKAVSNFDQVLGSSTDNKKRNVQITDLIAYVNEKMPEVLGSNVPSNTGKIIMVVDDSPTVRKLIIGKLEKHGHRVVAAVDGMDALAKINETVPDLILLDVTMPRLDGYQLCKLVKANAKTKHVPIVMISGKDGFFDKVRGRMAGSTAYITKPFGPETLLQTVDSYCS